MAIGPAVLQASFKRESIEFEKLIDGLLSQQKMYDSQVIINSPKGMNEKHLDCLRANYLKAGWTKITWNSTQRDGDSITFKVEPDILINRGLN